MRRTFISHVSHYSKLLLKGFWPAAKQLFEEFRAFMQGVTPEESKYILEHSKDLQDQIAKPLKFTFSVIAVAVGFFVVWGSFAPLDSAVIAPGFVVLSNNRKTIQHLEGGVIEKIFVKDGEFVKQGQALIMLNDKAASARVQIALSKLRVERALEQTLLAEKFYKDKIDFSDDIFDKNEPEVQKLIKNQESLFNSRMELYNVKKDIYLKKIAESEEAIRGYQALLNSYSLQAKTIREQYESLEALFKKGYAKKYDLLEKRRILEDVDGRVAGTISDITKAQHMLSESKLQLIDLENEWQTQIDTELKKVHAAILDLREQYRADKDVLDRSIIRAPTSGIVTALRYHTVGGVISHSSPIMEIIPQDDQLIVEAHVSPQDIESIHAGLMAKIQLSAYKTRLVPRIDGKVIYVSADRVDEKNGLQPGQMPYYVAQVEIIQDTLSQINYDVKLQPGMPAEVFIIKGERTFLQYMLSPLIDSFHKAFKEK